MRANESQRFMQHEAENDIWQEVGRCIFTSETCTQPFLSDR